MSEVRPYPKFMPPPIDQGYDFSLPPMKQETGMVSGYTRMRQRFGAPPPTYNMTFWFTSKQLSFFRAYWMYELKSGSLATEIPMLVPEDMNKLVVHRGRFLGNYRPSVPDREYDSWLVQCQFILEKDTVVSFEEYINLYFGGDLRRFNIEMRDAIRQWPRMPGQDY